MREKLKITEGIFPMPVLMVATYNEDGSVNVMNAAWGTMQERDVVALNLTESHKTVKNILDVGGIQFQKPVPYHICRFFVSAYSNVGIPYLPSLLNLVLLFHTHPLL